MEQSTFDKLMVRSASQNKSSPTIILMNLIILLHTSHPIPLRSILLLSFHLCLGLKSGLFLSGIPTKIVYVFFISHRHTTFSTHLILGFVIVQIMEVFFTQFSSASCNSL